MAQWPIAHMILLSYVCEAFTSQGFYKLDTAY